MHRISNIIQIVSDKIQKIIPWISNQLITSSPVYNETEAEEIFSIKSEMIGDSRAAQNNNGMKRSMRLGDLQYLGNELSPLKDKLLNYNNNDEISLAEDLMDIYFSLENMKKQETIMSKEFTTIEDQKYSNFLRQSITALKNKLEKKIEMSNQQNK